MGENIIDLTIKKRISPKKTSVAHKRKVKKKRFSVKLLGLQCEEGKPQSVKCFGIFPE